MGHWPKFRPWNMSMWYSQFGCPWNPWGPTPQQNSLTGYVESRLSMGHGCLTPSASIEHSSHLGSTFIELLTCCKLFSGWKPSFQPFSSTKLIKPGFLGLCACNTNRCMERCMERCMAARPFRRWRDGELSNPRDRFGSEVKPKHQTKSWQTRVQSE